jgi:hypothetical protein
MSDDTALSDPLRDALEDVRRKIAVGMDQVDRGELFDGEEFFRELLKGSDTSEREDRERASPDRSR